MAVECLEVRENIVEYACNGCHHCVAVFLEIVEYKSCAVSDDVECKGENAGKVA